jgi:uncharacterized HAD superfamily protein
MPSLGWQYVEYRGLDDLELAVQRVALALPRDVELVVGIPRSGLLAGSVLALALNLPLTDLDGFLEGRVLGTGRRPRRDTSGSGRAVVIDDSVSTGTQIRDVRARLEATGRMNDVVLAAGFVTRTSAALVDVFGEVVEPPRIFAWNILHHPDLLAKTCVDIDGVLCIDPTEVENDDGPRYQGFLGEAQPLFLPTSPVGWVVTSRLERYRAQTEAWLREHGVEYGELVMLDLATAEERRALGAHARHKAEVYARSGAELFVESEFGQAVEIAARSGRQVFAVDRRRMVYPTPRQAAVAAPRLLARSFGRTPPARMLTVRTRALVGRAAGPLRAAIGRLR